MTTMKNDHVSNDKNIDNQKSTKKKISSKKQAPEKQDRGLKGTKYKDQWIEFAQPVAPILLCPLINNKVKLVYTIMGLFNPCLTSTTQLAKILKMNKHDVKECLEELRARKIILLIKEGAGRQSSLYEFEMNPCSWQLDSPSQEIVTKKKRTYGLKSKEENVCGDNRSPEKLVCGDNRSPENTESNVCGDNRSPEKLVCGDNRSPESEICGDNRSPENSPYIERYLKQIDLDISLSKENIAGQGRLSGPAELITFKVEEPDSPKIVVKKNARDARFSLN